ncbi:RNA polymerase subunit sigma-70 [Chryseobacterium sp. T16E-39]|uniref:sigma-70 family RNA polymerase sigma factor n=1 Tax=Chryseobacterium sp. T16E-39 TaxID=2015076 RepID=UPI000B5B1B4A|nr:sigma-70 family RNA polymerase sigma factor [Chryseobacterium sp. T16E-39]ASK32351.1 RNA polymerase subunit sigma-70 [Chryseobacterium sp. T16E-39]
MTTEQLLSQYQNELYHFILKKVKDRFVAEEVLQNSCLKIHQGISVLKDESKARAWAYRIVRNEIINFLQQNKNISRYLIDENISDTFDNVQACCLDHFIKALPEIYKMVLVKIYVEGKSQNEVAKETELSLANVKARLRRAKDLLKNNFVQCCKYEINASGKLKGESKCTICN